MLIHKLSLLSFRNYRSEEVSPSGGTNIFLGQNAQGKTALLEAVYVLATSKSHRTSKDSDMIRVGEESARIAAEVERENLSDTLIELILSRNEKKTIRINRTRHDRIADLLGQLNAVIFSSYDLEMVKGDPSARRRFLNLEVSQTSPQYVYAYGRYKRVLEHRNGLLKSYKNRQADLTQLSAFDEQLASYGSIVLERRLAFLKRLSDISGSVYSQLTDAIEELQVKYQPSFDLAGAESAEDIKKRFVQVLESGRNQELGRGVTLFGPQRDDIKFAINGLDAKAFGSEGQQRSVALAVKLAEVSLLEEVAGEPPVVLLDDVTAELDERRRSHVFDFTFGRCQTLVTVTDLTGLPSEVVKEAQIFDVVSGEVRAR